MIFMKISAKKVIIIFILLAIVIFIFVVGVIFSGRYILTTKNSGLNDKVSLPKNSAVNLFSEIGLPAGIIDHNNSEFLAFINTSAKDGEHGYFQKSAEADLFLTNINNLVSITGDGSTSTVNFFDASGQPLFFQIWPSLLWRNDRV